MMKIN